MCQNDNKFMGEFSINNNISDVTIEKKKWLQALSRQYSNLFMIFGRNSRCSR